MSDIENVVSTYSGDGNRYKLDLSKVKVLDDLAKMRREDYGIPDPFEATFEDLMEHNDFYYFTRTFVEKLMENTGGKIPKGLVEIMKAECEKAITSVIMDITQNKRLAYNFIRCHKFQLDRYLYRADIYEDTSNTKDFIKKFVM